MTEIQQKLFDKKIVVIDGDISIDTFHYVREVIGKLSLLDEAPDLTISITCNGGNTDPALYIYDSIKLYKGKTTGQVLGFARSAAALLLQACSVRQMTKHSYLLVHDSGDNTRRTANDLRNKEKMGEVIKAIEALQQKKIEILSSRTGQSAEFITKLLAKDIDLDANEAKGLNFIDEII